MRARSSSSLSSEVRRGGLPIDRVEEIAGAVFVVLAGQQQFGETHDAGHRRAFVGRGRQELALHAIHFGLAGNVTVVQHEPCCYLRKKTVEPEKPAAVTEKATTG